MHDGVVLLCWTAPFSLIIHMSICSTHRYASLQTKFQLNIFTGAKVCWKNLQHHATPGMECMQDELWCGIMSYRLSVLSVDCEYFFSQRSPLPQLVQTLWGLLQGDGILRRIIQRIIEDFTVNYWKADHVALLCSETHRHLEGLASRCVVKGVKCPMADW